MARGPSCKTNACTALDDRRQACDGDVALARKCDAVKSIHIIGVMTASVCIRIMNSKPCNINALLAPVAASPLDHAHSLAEVCKLLGAIKRLQPPRAHCVRSNVTIQTIKNSSRAYGHQHAVKDALNMFAGQVSAHVAEGFGPCLGRSGCCRAWRACRSERVCTCGCSRVTKSRSCRIAQHVMQLEWGVADRQVLLQIFKCEVSSVCLCTSCFR